jgi:arylsulfatase A-like enzyme
MNQLVTQLAKSLGGLQMISSKVLTTSATGILLGVVLCVSATFAQTPTSSASERPNVLFIAIDDLRPALGCYGDLLAKSPNIDQFAKSARRFNQAYVQQAVCGPSRASLLTGLLPDHTQVWHNRNRFRETRPNHVTLPQLFKQNGYRTLGFGKIFSGNEKELDPISWSEPEVLRRKGWKNYVLSHNQGKEKKQAAYEVADVADAAYPDGKLADLAVKTLENLKKDGGPFFLAVGFLKPHLPFNAPKKYWDLYDRAAFELPEGIREPVRLSPKIALHSHRELGGYKGVPKDEDLDVEQSRLLRHGYYACVSYVDAQVGKVMGALKRLGLEQNTIVVIWGDHGFALGETNRWCKATNFELDTRVPLLIRTPDLTHPGVATDSLVEMVDLYPTLAALAGLKTPADLDGRSFATLLSARSGTRQEFRETKGNAAESLDHFRYHRDVVLSQFNRPWTSATPEVMGYSIRTKNARYTRWIDWRSRKTIAEELYDYSGPQNVTPHAGQLIEQQNIAASHLDLLGRMSDQMDELLASRLRWVRN